MSLTAEKAWKLVKEELGYIENSEDGDPYVINAGTWREFPTEGDFETKKVKVECIESWEQDIGSEIFSVFKITNKETDNFGFFKIIGEHDSWGGETYWTDEFDKVEKATKTVEYWRVINE